MRAVTDQTHISSEVVYLQGLGEISAFANLSSHASYAQINNRKMLRPNEVGTEFRAELIAERFLVSVSVASVCWCQPRQSEFPP